MSAPRQIYASSATRRDRRWGRRRRTPTLPSLIAAAGFAALAGELLRSSLS
jgi:hypothetical protein